MVDPTDYIAIKDIEFILGKRVNPVVVTASQMETAIKSLDTRGISEIRVPKLKKALSASPKKQPTTSKCS